LEISKLEGFLKGLLEHIDLKGTSVIVTSDHGNMEDLYVKTHTKNPVATLLWGRGSEELAHEILSLEDISPSIKTLLPTAFAR
jgi:bisphosphoglycerate-independent phosphoglycerate mutase (AlkP superfamily)